jgi:hypothetical protein
VNLYALLPLTVAVAERGAVTVESPSRVIAMSPYSERARRLALDFGPGTHVIATSEDVADLPNTTFADLTDAFA